MKILSKFTSDKKTDEDAIEEEIEDEIPDSITGLHHAKYLLNEGYDEMVEMLDQLRKKRNEDSELKKNIKLIAEELGINLDKLSHDIEAFVQHRALIEAG